MVNRLEHAVKHCAKLKAIREGKPVKIDRHSPKITTSHLIYFIQAGDYVKVGLSKRESFKLRVSSIQTGNPHKLKVLRIIPTNHPRRDERQFHFMLRAYRVQGEWFKITSESILALLSVAKPL